MQIDQLVIFHGRNSKFVFTLQYCHQMIDCINNGFWLL